MAVIAAAVVDDVNSLVQTNVLSANKMSKEKRREIGFYHCKKFS